MGTKKTKKADATTNESQSETTVDAQPQSATATQEPAPEASKPAKKGSKKKATSGGALTLADLSEKYLMHLADGEWSGGTIASYSMELKTAMTELGAATPVLDLTPEKVQAFFTCKRVTKLKSGKAKAKPSIDKTRRVLRLALVWAVEAGLIEIAPLPEATANA